MKTIIIGCIRLYAYAISPLFGASCRYQPTCSEYARLAIERHGLWRGSRLAMFRLASCGPGGGSGEDPVPVLEEPAARGAANMNVEMPAVITAETAAEIAAEINSVD